MAGGRAVPRVARGRISRQVAGNGHSADAAARWRLWRGLVRVVLGLALAALGLVVLFRWVNPPPGTLMIAERLRLGGIEREWVALSAMSPNLPLSAAAAEDANFCRHWGFDVEGIRAALADSERVRGGSTISQQVAKNVFLWPGRSWLRKGLEAGFTGLIEILWPKRRIMEVYLNVAEMDEGVFGVEAAARHYWGVGAADLGPQRSARLMAVLPDPRDARRSRGRPTSTGAGRRSRRGRRRCARTGGRTAFSEGCLTQDGRFAFILGPALVRQPGRGARC